MFASSFGLHKNMSYNFGDYAEVRANVDEFLNMNDFSTQNRLITAVPVHKNKFLVLNQELFDSLDGKDFSDRSIGADGIITNLKNAPVAFKPADCAVIGFEISQIPLDLTLKKGKVEFISLLHVGFDDYLKDAIAAFGKFVGTGLVPVLRQQSTISADKRGVSFQIDRIHVFPFLQKYRIDYGDFHSDKYDWDSIDKIQKYIEEDENGRFVNFHEVVYNELVEVFGKERVDWSRVKCTWELAKDGKGFSHSYSFFNSAVENGRNIVVGEIR